VLYVGTGAMVTNSTFSGNSVDIEGGYGGGIYNYDGGFLTVTNSTFSGNFVDWEGGYASGGGIYNYDGGFLTVTNSTFSSNEADTYGSGIYNAGEAHLAGNLFDTPIGSSNCEDDEPLTDNGYNLSDDTTCTDGGTGSATGVTLNLSALSSGGPGQQVHTPADPSDAIGVIPNGTSINNEGVTLACDQTTTDQLGADRPINTGDACTSGAVEVALPPVVCDIGDTSIAKTNTTTAQLSWTNSGDPAAEYRVFRSALPYSGYVHLNETVSGTSHDVTIDPLQNYNYEVRGYANAEDDDNEYSCKSGRFGVFSFALVPGS